MAIIGTDSHKRNHTFMAVDEVGRKVGEKTLAATTEGHLEALAWAEQWQERSWAIEDCRHLTRRLESDLLKGGEAVVRVPTKLMAAERRGDRERGKSDPIDALAVARAALREPNLPVARLDGPSRELKLLVDHLEDLVRERTRMQARLRWHLHELFPGLVIPSRSLRRQRVFAELEILLQPLDGTIVPHRTRAPDLNRRPHEKSERARARDHGARPRGRSIVARPSGLRRALSGQDLGRSCWRIEVQIQGCLRSLERNSAHPRVERKHQLPPKSWGQ